MSEQEDTEIDQTMSFLESPESEYLDRNATKQKRNRYDFLGDTLLILQREGPLTMTHVMYKLYTNYQYYEPLVHFLVRKGYIETTRMRNSTKRFYELTEKGLQAVELYKRVKELFEE